jgi:hypothetical protein
MARSGTRLLRWGPSLASVQLGLRGDVAGPLSLRPLARALGSQSSVYPSPAARPLRADRSSSGQDVANICRQTQPRRVCP